MAGLGMQTFLTENLSLKMQLRYCHLFDQHDDNIGTDDVNNGILQVGISLSYYFFGWKDKDGDGIHDKNDLALLEPEDLTDLKMVTVFLSLTMTVTVCRI